MTPDSYLHRPTFSGQKTMTTKTFEIQALFGALDHLAIAKKIRNLPGVSAVEVNAALTTASVTHDESTMMPEHIKHAIKECGFHCTGDEN